MSDQAKLQPVSADLSLGASAIPRVHSGETYTSVLSRLASTRAVRRYLEIGVCTGDSLAQISCDRALGVDPDFRLSHNVAAGKRDVRLFQMPSDLFFAEIDAAAALGGPVDFAFLDGMHQFEYLLRDFYNTERISSPKALIAIHDCLPLSEAMIQRSAEEAIQLGQGSAHEGWWTGDVWKVVVILRALRPDLRVICVDAPPTGLVFVSNLDPSNDTLERDYCAIVDQYAALPNSMDGLAEFYRSIEIMPTAHILNAWDHSLYFRA
ncbi:class I SAM-dependent methyltransferase [Xanthobacter sp. KR7-65]|uniref:class I SAM-dependent methyltransferase n=1 Tax=Xanthobacter sp. KR7-65 TaxID=3156612 RepID=UPI0032B43C6A